MATETHDDLISVRQAAQECGRNPETVRRWIWSGRLPSVKLGNQLFVKRSLLAQFFGEAAVTSGQTEQQAVVGQNTLTLDTGRNTAVDGQSDRSGVQTETGATTTPAISKPRSKAETIIQMRRLRDSIRSRTGRMDLETGMEEARGNGLR